MKPSGIEWIGDIPDDWEVTKIGQLYLERNEKVSDREYEALSVTKHGILKQLESAAKTDNGDNRKLVKSGDFVINSRSDRRGSCGISKFDGSVSLINIILMPTQKIANGYYNYLFRTENFADEFYKYGNGIVDDLWSTKWTSMKKILVPFPSLRTQQRIADYLDEKCGEIDATISKQKESIEKLKAYKQSLISETVTKGLDKSAPLKPSGIEWIGDIPDDWEVTKISRLYSIQLGKMLQPEKKSSGDTYEPYICAANLSSGTFRLDEVKYMWISEPEKDIYRLKRDDLLVTEGGDVGISSIWKDDISPCYFQNALHRVVPKKGNSNRFLHYWLIVLKSVGYIDLICNKSTIAHFTKEKFAQSLILSIPLQTQEKIADYLDSKCSQIDKYITEKQNIIQKLDAYKKSLIFECVTGKHKI